LFLFTGDEFLRKKKIEQLTARLAPDLDRATDLYRVYPDDVDWSLLMTQARTPSLNGNPQVFCFSGVERIKGTDWSAFENYCLAPTEKSFFIFEAEELSASHPLVKLVGRFGSHTHLEERKEGSGARWLADKVERAHKKMKHEAWQILEERCGGSLNLMDSCLDQLISYSDGEWIDEDAVRKMTTQFLNYDVFDLTDALLEKDTVKALKIFHFFYGLNGDVASTVGLIHWQLKRMWQAKKMLAAKVRQEEISRTLRVPPSRIGHFLRQAQVFDLRAIEELIDRLWRSDWESKTGAADELIALETFLARAC